MLVKISAVKVRQNLGQVMNLVAIRGDDYIVERAGKPLVAIIPIERYQELQAKSPVAPAPEVKEPIERAAPKRRIVRTTLKQF